MKKLLIFGLVFIGIAIVALVVISFIPESREITDQILEVKWLKITVSSIEEFGYTEDNLLRKGISPEQVRDILNHPDRYRDVTFSFRFSNHSTWAAVSRIEIEKHLPEEAKKRLVWMSDNLFMPFVEPAKKERPDHLGAIFKLEEGDTEEDLMEICKQIRFTLKGEIVEPDAMIDDPSYGSVFVPIRYSGE